MPFPDRLRSACVALALLAPAAAWAGAEQVRAELTARLQGALPGTPPVAEEGPGAAAALEEGKRIWTRKFKNGRTLAGCFPNGGRRVAATYPQYDPRLKTVVTLEMAINQCLKAHKEPLLDLDEPATMGAAAAYARSLAVGQKLAVRVPAAAEAPFEEARRLYFTRMGQRNYACASCHVQGAGKRYADMPLAPVIGQAAQGTLVRDTSALGLQARIRECLERMGAAPFPAGSLELNNLEFFLAYLSNGLPLRPAIWRPAR